jgi:endonuclease/exonuclease/phosphatase family metal-dependent hydrolase
MKLFLRNLTGCLGLLLLVGCQHSPHDATPLTIRVMTYNIHHGRGMDGEVDLGRIAKLIREQEVDLVALQEVDKGTQRTDGIDIAAELARLTGMHFVFAKNIDFQGGEYGNAILSRQPILSSTNRHYKMLRPGEQRGLLSATIGFGGRVITFASTHLDFRPDPAERISNMGEIEEFVSAAGKNPVVIAGDFNDVPGGTVHRRMKETFTDVWEAGGTGDGFTYSSEEPDKRIDYIYLFPKTSWRVKSANVPTSTASDHLPLVAEATLSN